MGSIGWVDFIPEFPSPFLSLSLLPTNYSRRNVGARKCRDCNPSRPATCRLPLFSFLGSPPCKRYPLLLVSVKCSLPLHRTKMQVVDHVDVNGLVVDFPSLGTWAIREKARLSSGLQVTAGGLCG